MPTYEYRCKLCERVIETFHGIKESPKIPCPKCREPMDRIISKNIAGFSIKGGTASIHYREKRNRVKRNQDLEKRQRERYGDGPKIAPNIAGVRTDSWSDAQKMAKEAGMNHESYTPYVEKEKKKHKGKIITQVK